MDEPRCRSEDTGMITRLWDWIDERDIDKHIVSICILYGTVIVTKWGMRYAEMHADKSGLEVAAVMAAILAPYMALQAAAINYYFRART
jgi:hypothetical protein